MADNQLIGAWVTFAAFAIPLNMLFAVHVMRSLRAAYARKVGGIWFIRAGKYGGSFYVSTRRAKVARAKPERAAPSEEWTIPQGWQVVES